MSRAKIKMVAGTVVTCADGRHTAYSTMVKQHRVASPKIQHHVTKPCYYNPMLQHLLIIITMIKHTPDRVVASPFDITPCCNTNNSAGPIVLLLRTLRIIFFSRAARPYDRQISVSTRLYPKAFVCSIYCRCLLISSRV